MREDSMAQQAFACLTVIKSGRFGGRRLDRHLRWQASTGTVRVGDARRDFAATL